MGIHLSFVEIKRSQRCLRRGIGTGIVSIDRNQSNLNFIVTSTDLEGEITDAHFHFGEVGENGEIVFDLIDAYVDQSAAGFLTEDDGFGEEISELFKNGSMYWDIHTDKFPEGEIRGQVERTLRCPETSVFASINSTTKENTLFIMYPNPSSNLLTIEYKGQEELEYVSIYDINGKRIYHKRIRKILNQMGIDVSDFANGFYNVEIGTEKMIITERFLKE